jgi:hypothetical protein
VCHAASRSLEDRFEQVLAKFLQAEERGECPDRSELLRTQPDLETRLREFFCNRDRLDRLASRLRPTVPQPGAAPQAEPPPVSHFGSYTALEQVGQGGRGIVYRVKVKRNCPRQRGGCRGLATNRRCGRRLLPRTASEVFYAKRHDREPIL